MIKKFLLPLQNMVRADLFSGFLAVWNFRGGAAHFCPPAQSEPRKARRGNSVRTILRIHRNKSGFKFPQKIWSARSAVCSEFPPRNPDSARIRHAPRGSSFANTISIL
ncbi:hypothetical protein IT401_00725 [Candidatus Nomurabacteria bacterium]|nr:hypothetical protein [Candidatus Nomurabacteria bacterium]